MEKTGWNPGKETKENATLEQIETFLKTAIEQLERIHSDPYGRGRPLVLPAMCLWAGVLVCVTRLE